MSLAKGIAQGMGLVNAHFDRQDRKERLDRQEARQTELDRRSLQQYQDAIKYRDAKDAKEQERYEAGLSLAQAERDESKRRFDLSYQLQSDQHEIAMANAEKQGKLVDLQLGKAEEARANEAAIKVMQLWEAGQVPDEKGYEALRNAGLDPDLLFDPQLGESINVAEQVFTGKLSAQSPEALSAVNRVFKSELQAGVGSKAPNGSTITDKQIVSVFPGDGQKVPKDHVVFEVEVTTEDGQKYRAPLTQNRSTDPNDPIRPIPIDKIVSHFRGLQRIQNEPGLKKIYAAMGHTVDSKGKGKWEKLNDGALFNEETGAFKTADGQEGTLSPRDKERLKNLRSQYTALSRNVMPNDEAGQAKLAQLEQQMNSVLEPDKKTVPINPNAMVESDAAGFSPDPANTSRQPAPQFTNAQQSDIQKVLDANPKWDQDKAVAYLKHLNRW